MSLRRAIILLMALMVTNLALPDQPSASGKDLWGRWTAYDAVSARNVDHTDWDAILKTYVITGPVNRFRYAHVTAADKARLESYIATLSTMPVSALNRAEQLAYWINLYNALTVQLVLKHYPVSSIRKIDISPGLFSVGPWDKALVTIEHFPVTLNDIEHRILRPVWNDPRLHYALNCASLGCPNLQPAAFTPDNTVEMLERGARDYINGHGTAIKDNRLIISKIYSWFRDDFGSSDADVITHLSQYAAPDLAAKIRHAGKIHDYAYDWSLNDSLP